MLPRCQPSRQERVLFSGGRSPPAKRFACRQILPIVTIATHPDDQPAAGARPVRGHRGQGGRQQRAGGRTGAEIDI